jgi:hypothetical protein
LHPHRLQLGTLLFLSFFLSSATLLSEQFKDNELPIDQVFFSIEQNESVFTHLRNLVCAGSLVLKRFFPCRQKQLRQHKLMLHGSMTLTTPLPSPPPPSGVLYSIPVAMIHLSWFRWDNYTVSQYFALSNFSLKSIEPMPQ